MDYFKGIVQVNVKIYQEGLILFGVVDNVVVNQDFVKKEEFCCLYNVFKVC